MVVEGLHIQIHTYTDTCTYYTRTHVHFSTLTHTRHTHTHVHTHFTPLHSYTHTPHTCTHILHMPHPYIHARTSYTHSHTTHIYTRTHAHTPPLHSYTHSYTHTPMHTHLTPIHTHHTHITHIRTHAYTHTTHYNTHIYTCMCAHTPQLLRPIKEPIGEGGPWAHLQVCRSEHRSPKEEKTNLFVPPERSGRLFLGGLCSLRCPCPSCLCGHWHWQESPWLPREGALCTWYCHSGTGNTSCGQRENKGAASC